MRVRDIFKYIYSDFIRYYGYDRANIYCFIKCYFLKPGFRYTFWFRLAKSKCKSISYISRFILHCISRKYFIEIPYNTEIGYGLFISHGGSIIINSTAKIGNNVNIGHFCTIGSNHGKAAIIGNNVYIGPNVSIVEDVIIGDESIIGAGSVVVKSIRKNSTAVGVPSRVINEFKTNKYIKNRYCEKYK